MIAIFDFISTNTMKNQNQHHFGCHCCSPLYKFFLPDMKAVFKKGKPKKDEPANVIFKVKMSSNDRGYILTMKDGQEAYVEAMGIYNGEIISVGDLDRVKQDMKKYNCKDEITISDGNILMPSFIEPHAHILSTAAFNMAIDMSPFLGQYLRTSVGFNSYNRKAVLEWISDGLKKAQNDDWVIGRHVDPSLFTGEEREFNASVLDKVNDDTGKDNPIFIMHASMHIAYVNTAGIGLLNGAAGESGFKIGPSGVIEEMEIIPALTLLAGLITIDKEKFEEEVYKILDQASERGITYLLDAGTVPFKEGQEDDQVEVLRGIAEANCSVRIGAAIVSESIHDFRKYINPRYTPNAGGKNADLFNIAFLKVVSDGSNQGMTGYQTQPYCCDENYNLFEVDIPEELPKQTNTGIFNYGYPVEFNNMIKEAHEAGWPIMTHANGDKANDWTISAYKGTGMSQFDPDPKRHRIEHASLLSDANLADMEKLGVSPSFLIGHVGYWGWVLSKKVLGAERAGLLDRTKSALNHNLRITMHSDYGVSPLGSLRLMEQGITRIMEGAPIEEKGAVLNSPERLSRLEALRAVTYDAAWQSYADRWVGSLERGKCADFVILEKNPLTFENHLGDNLASGMRDIQVLETWKGGVKRYSSK
jgi:predicted amidohydrolase YtcJ